MTKLLILLFATLLWTLPSAQVAGEGDDHDNHSRLLASQDHDEHEGHDHDGDADDHEGHDHGESVAVPDEIDEHAGHDHAGDDHGDDGDALVVHLSTEAVAMAGITLAEAEHGRIARMIDLPGEVGFNEDRLVYISPRFAGIAVEAKYRIGDYVREGEVVAVIESNESLNAYSIKSPISGWVIERHVSPGEYVSEENSIYVVADLSTVWVNLAVYPKDADQIRPGLEVHISAIGSDSQTEGTIEYVSPILDPQTRSMTARVVIRNPKNAWRPGTFVTARGMTTSGDDGLLIARDAVQVLDEEHVVFVAAGSGRFTPRPVLTGNSDDRYTRVISGLRKGEEYVATGAFELKAKIVTSSLDAHAGHGH